MDQYSGRSCDIAHAFEDRLQDLFMPCQSSGAIQTCQNVGQIGAQFGERKTRESASQGPAVLMMAIQNCP
jgi:hypothetical protein